MSQMDQKAPQPGQNMNMNMNNMGGMVGGAPGMEHGAAPRGSSAAAYDGRQMLNTYIYDYFCKNNMFECALALLKSPDAEVQIDGNFRPSPSRRPQKHESDGGMNGIDDESMDGSDGQRQGDDSDDIKNIKDLPPAKAQQRFRNEQLMRMNPNNPALMGQQMNMPGGYPARMMAGVMNGGVHGGQEGAGSPGDMAHKSGQLQRSVLTKLTAGRGPHQMNPLGRPQLIQHMQNREGEVNDMNGQQRPQSPAAAAASPGNKRVRLENGQYEPVGNGRGGTPQGVPPGMNQANVAAAHQLLIANGINPNSLTPQQLHAFQGQPALTQQRSIQAYAQNMAAATGKNLTQLQGGPKGMPQNPGQAGSPMMPQTSEGGLGGGMGDRMGDFYTPGGGMRTAGGLSGTGNHALQDYQMQLMLLEQQNKKRLMQARQEQDHIATHGDGNRPGSYHQSMSPNSRAAPSPGPGGKPNIVGTPKIPNQVGPSSPLPDGQMGAHVQQRNSPASAAGFNGQISEGGHSMINYPMGNNGAGVPNGASMMRPPGSFDGQMAQPGMAGQMNPNMRPQQAGRGQPAGGMWHPQQQQQQQMMQQQGQPQSQQPGQPQQNQPPQQVGTPQPGRQNLPHTAMPPPQAPPNVPNPGRPAPASPQVTNQPPTPTQSNKPNPKGKATREPAKKPRSKKGAAPATQAPSAVTPTTSEPPTPTTPQHPNSFGNPNHARSNFTSGGPNQPGNTPAGQPVQQPTPNPAPTAQAVPDPVQSTSTFGAMGDIGVDFGETFGDGSADLLDNFDFDSFLNTTEGDSGSLGFGENLQWTNDNEVGAGES